MKTVWRFDPFLGLYNDRCVEKVEVEDGTPVNTWIPAGMTDYCYLGTEAEVLTVWKIHLEASIQNHKAMLLNVEDRLEMLGE